MPKVLITGVAGFLGSHLADAFLSKGYSVTGIDNLVGGYEENVPSGVNFHKIDLSTKIWIFIEFSKQKQLYLKNQKIFPHFVSFGIFAQ